MGTIIGRAMKAPTSLEWWAYLKLAGVVALPLLLAVMSLGFAVHPLLVGLVLHLALDFTLQSSWVAAEKSGRGRALFFHSLIAGGLPLAVMGMMSGSPITALVSIVAGITSHYAIDWTNRFGLGDCWLGYCLDQAAHVAVLTVVL